MTTTNPNQIARNIANYILKESAKHNNAPVAITYSLMNEFAKKKLYCNLQQTIARNIMFSCPDDSKMILLQKTGKGHKNDSLSYIVVPKETFDISALSSRNFHALTSGLIQDIMEMTNSWFKEHDVHTPLSPENSLRLIVVADTLYRRGNDKTFSDLDINSISKHIMCSQEETLELYLNALAFAGFIEITEKPDLNGRARVRQSLQYRITYTDGWVSADSTNAEDFFASLDKGLGFPEGLDAMSPSEEFDFFNSIKNGTDKNEETPATDVPASTSDSTSSVTIKDMTFSSFSPECQKVFKLLEEAKSSLVSMETKHSYDVFMLDMDILEKDKEIQKLQSKLRELEDNASAISEEAKQKLADYDFMRIQARRSSREADEYKTKYQKAAKENRAYKKAMQERYKRYSTIFTSFNTKILRELEGAVDSQTYETLKLKIPAIIIDAQKSVDCVS